MQDPPGDSEEQPALKTTEPRAGELAQSVVRAGKTKGGATSPGLPAIQGEEGVEIIAALPRSRALLGCGH